MSVLLRHIQVHGCRVTASPAVTSRLRAPLGPTNHRYEKVDTPGGGAIRLVGSVDAHPSIRAVVGPEPTALVTMGVDTAPSSPRWAAVSWCRVRRKWSGS